MADKPRARSTREELERAAHELSMTEAQFRILLDTVAAPILKRIEETFVERQGLRWWWYAFRDAPTAPVHFVNGTGWSCLTRIVPPEMGLVWFVVENQPGFILCEGTINAVQSIIGECWAFEYYVVSQNLDWLVCENHSDAIYAVGAAVSERLAEVSAS